MKSSNIPYIKEVDQLRGLAALLIVSYHTLYIAGHKLVLGKTFTMDNAVQYLPQTFNPFIRLIMEGHIAVGLFMVLSGFIFAYGAQGSTVSWPAFVYNRLLRIYPLFMVLFFLSIYTTTQEVTWASIVQTILPIGLFKGNIPWTPFISMFWTVAIEFQFYLLFPFLMTIFTKQGWLKILPWMLASFIALRLLAILFGANPYQMSYYSICGRIDQFLIGMTIGIIYAQGGISKKTLRRLFPVFVLLVFGLLYFYLGFGTKVFKTRWRIFFPTIEGLVLAGFILTYLEAAKKWWRAVARPLELTGTISYSIYMLHIPIVWLVSERNLFIKTGGPAFLDLTLTFLILIAPMTIALSILTYNGIEKPFLSLRRAYLKNAK